MSKRDFYETLGVQRTANADEIRRAYRKLAREFHPDVNKSPDAAKRFAEVQDAYEVLSDEKKRAQYDRFGHVSAASEGGSPGSTSGAGPFRWSGGSAGAEFDMDDIGSVFDAFFGSRYGSPQESAPGTRGGRGRRAQRQQTVEISIPFLTAARGGTHTVRLKHGPAGSERVSTLEVRIPRATAEGAKLRVKPPGEEVSVVLLVHVEQHPILSRVDANGLDLQIEVPLTISEAILGASVRVPTIEGSATLTVPSGTSSGRKLRLRGMGLKDESGKEGDLYAIARIVIPDTSTLSESERQTIEVLGQRQGSPRSGAGWPT